jgi:hypothetical protein
MTNQILALTDRAAQFVGALTIAAVLLTSAPALAAMVSASRLFGA